MGIESEEQRGYGQDRRRWPATGSRVLDFLSVRRVADGRDIGFDEPSSRRKSALHWARLARTKGSQPFRESMPERFNRAKGWVFMSALPVARVAWHPAETFRCRPCDLDRTAGSRAMIYR